jgi:hypothetical protein
VVDGFIPVGLELVPYRAMSDCTVFRILCGDGRRDWMWISDSVPGKDDPFGFYLYPMLPDTLWGSEVGPKVPFDLNEQEWFEFRGSRD